MRSAGISGEGKAVSTSTTDHWNKNVNTKLLQKSQSRLATGKTFNLLS